jgi:hypothetical protein
LQERFKEVMPANTAIGGSILHLADGKTPAQYDIE